MSEPYYQDDLVTVHAGDCLDVLRGLADNSVDAVVTDPPYGLSFMSKEWDCFAAEGRGSKVRQRRAREMTPTGEGHSTSVGPYLAAGVDDTRQGGHPFQAWCHLWAAECLRVLKPGSHLLAFGGTRTSHRLACAIEDAGFEIRDSIAWLYGSGFPKSLDVSKAIDRAAGAERQVIGNTSETSGRTPGLGISEGYHGEIVSGHCRDITAPATDAARQWQGWGTALKPAHEPIVVARKPLTGTVAANVQAWGTGALNVDGCRIEGLYDSAGRKPQDIRGGRSVGADPVRLRDEVQQPHTAGRWPPNVVLDPSQAAALDQQSGESRSSGIYTNGATRRTDGPAAIEINREGYATGQYDDTGGASRYFYVAKADASERVRLNGAAHPTVKPLTLMRWLVRLITPPGGVILEPFAGSGTTVEAAILEGFRCVAIEREADYLPLIVQRINRRRDPVAAVQAAGEDMGLFELLGGEGA